MLFLFLGTLPAALTSFQASTDNIAKVTLDVLAIFSLFGHYGPCFISVSCAVGQLLLISGQLVSRIRLRNPETFVTLAPTLVPHSEVPSHVRATDPKFPARVRRSAYRPGLIVM